MYKRIEQKIKTADYERDMQEVLDILNDNREQHLQSKNNQSQQAAEESNQTKYLEKEIKTNFCRLCNLGFRFGNKSVNEHLQSETHIKNQEAYKERYAKYLYILKKQIFKDKQPKNNRLGKLKYFRLAYQYE